MKIFLKDYLLQQKQIVLVAFQDGNFHEEWRIWEGELLPIAIEEEIMLG